MLHKVRIKTRLFILHSIFIFMQHRNLNLQHTYLLETKKLAHIILETNLCCTLFYQLYLCNLFRQRINSHFLHLMFMQRKLAIRLNYLAFILETIHHFSSIFNNHFAHHFHDHFRVAFLGIFRFAHILIGKNV